jgi:ASCH domain
MSSSALEKVPALSVRQPWAELIVSGRKTIEVRSWTCAYRGRIWIHAAQRSDQHEESAFHFSHLPKGGYVGSVALCATVPLDRARWEARRANHLNLGEYRPGLYAWLLDGPNRFDAIVPARGQLNLFYPESGILSLLEKADATFKRGRSC